MANYTEEDVKAALIEADKAAEAGNKQARKDAQALADELRAMRDRSYSSVPNNDYSNRETVLSNDIPSRYDPPQKEERGFIDTLPQTAGGIVGGIAGAIRGFEAAPPVHPLAKPIGGFVGGVFGAAGGGAGGEALLQLGQRYEGSPNAPKTSWEAFQRMSYAGGEEAAWQAGGDIAGRVFGRAFNALRPKASEGIDELSKVFERYGGRFTMAQKTESWLVHQLDGLVRGSLTGSGPMKAADKLNEEALNKQQDALMNSIAASAKRNLSPQELGSLVENSLSGGRAAFNATVNSLYSQFDDMVVTKVVEEKVMKSLPTGLVGANGEPITRAVISNVQNTIKPVNIGPLIDHAAELADQLEKATGGLALSKEIGKDVISSLSKLDRTMKFSDAQLLRSTLLDIQRGITNISREAKLNKNISSFVTDITTAMDDAAAAQGVLDQYRAIKNYTRKGMETFNDKFVQEILKNADRGDYEKIGSAIYATDNASNVLRLKKALRTSSILTKGEVNYTETMDAVKQGYLEQIVREATGGAQALPGETAVQFQERSKSIKAAGLIKYFYGGKKTNTMSALLSKKEQEDLFTFIKTAAKLQEKPQGGLSMVAQLTQAGVVVAAASGGFSSIDPGSAAAVLIAPRAMAYMLRTGGGPVLAKALTTPSSHGSAIAGAVSGQLLGWARRANEELHIEAAPLSGVSEK